MVPHEIESVQVILKRPLFWNMFCVDWVMCDIKLLSIHSWIRASIRTCVYVVCKRKQWKFITRKIIICIHIVVFVNDWNVVGEYAMISIFLSNHFEYILLESSLFIITRYEQYNRTPKCQTICYGRFLSKWQWKFLHNYIQCDIERSKRL